jgi:ATP-binding cassette subfamily B protein
MSTRPPTDTSKKRAPAVSAGKRLSALGPYLARYKSGLALGLITLAVMSMVGNLIPLATGVITDSLAGSAQPLTAGKAVGPLGAIAGSAQFSFSRLIPFYQPHSRQTLAIYSLVLVGLVALKGLFSFWTRWTLIGVSRDIEYDIRNDLLSRLLLLEPEFYVRNRTGELMSRTTNDLNAVRMVLGPGIMYSATTLATMVLAIIVMLKISPILTLWVLIPVPVVAIVVRYFGQVIHQLYEQIQAALATLSARVQENLSGVRVVRAYGQEDAEIRGFDEPNRLYVSRNMHLIKMWSMFMPSLQALIGVTFLIVLWQGGRLLLNGRLTLGALISFYSYLGMLVWPMIALGWVTNIFQRGAASMGRLGYILNAKPAISDREALVSPDVPLRGEIDFRHLTFAYPTISSDGASRTRSSGGNGPSAAAEPVLRDINLHVPAGSTLAIIGPTGSGKTTLAALIARLWEAPRETLLLDGRSIREWPLERLRRAIGYVPQDTYLFSETVGGNIAFGVNDPTEQRIYEAAQIASLDPDIQDFPERYNTLVGERGITLSGGQKQRTALARAIIREPKILILDDALASVDTDTEEKILGRLKDVMRGRTTILISHRVSTVKNADQIIVLRDGGIMERGTHAELLATGGYYADLYQKQLLEEELERV